MKKDSVRATFMQQGMAVNVKDAPEFAAFLQEDIKRWAEVIRVANVKAE